MRKRDVGSPRVTFSVRIPAEHAKAIAEYAAQLTEATRLNVTPSAAGATVIEAGLIALKLIEAPKPAQKGAKKTARKP